MIFRFIDGPSSSVWGVLATAIVSGLTFASLITLLLTPTLLMLGQRFAASAESELNHQAVSQAS